MIFILRDIGDDATPYFELDEEGIDYFVQGLEALRLKEPGEEVTSPAFIEGDNGLPAAGWEFRLVRA
jgi:hypothetical protein